MTFLCSTVRISTSLNSAMQNIMSSFIYKIWYHVDAFRITFKGPGCTSVQCPAGGVVDMYLGIPVCLAMGLATWMNEESAGVFRTMGGRVCVWASAAALPSPFFLLTSFLDASVTRCWGWTFYSHCTDFMFGNIDIPCLFEKDIEHWSLLGRECARDTRNSLDFVSYPLLFIY